MTEPTIESIAEAGIVGAGGAGFPTHVKLSSQADTVLLNAAECEPLLHKDKEILRRHMDTVLLGLTAAMRIVGARRGFICIKEKYANLIDLLRPKLDHGIEIAPLQDVYPAGDELVLVYNVLGRVIPPGKIPLNVGVVVMNVETSYNVGFSPWQPLTTKFVSVAGAVIRPVTVQTPIGTPFSACVAAAGGPSIPDPQYVVGGVMMGRLEEDSEALVEKTTSGIIVLPRNHVVVKRKRRDWRQVVRIGKSACDQCSFCTELCPRYLLGHPIEPHRAMRSLMFNRIGEANVQGTAFCCECNLCSMYACPEDLDPKEVCSQNKQRLIAEKNEWDNPPFNPKRPLMYMDDRKAPMKRLMQKLGLLEFVNGGPLIEQPLRPNKVGIKLKQHIGVSCKPAVQVGQEVKSQEVVGRPPMIGGKPAQGVPVHASIDGTVTAIEQGVVWIEKK
jgi:Na+-translocating ferredoxin:NAD+ oxidoreductase RnfC subunit